MAATTMPPVVDPSTVPGALQERAVRELPDGSKLIFEYAPAGFLKKDGEPRREDWRAYFFEAAHGCDRCDGTGRAPSAKRPGKTVQCAQCKGTGSTRRERLTSVTTLLGYICPKPALVPWAEARGIEGAVEAIRLGEIDPHRDSGEIAVARVRALKLGADKARDDAAERGLNVHTLLRIYMEHGAPPNPADHPESHRGYIRAFTRWALAVDPEPLEVEQIVASVRDGYAGRLDLRCRVGGQTVLYDAKTQERAGIYDAGHLQTALYDRAAVACGSDPADELRVVCFAADGEHREMVSVATPEAVDAALAYARAIRPITSACEQANRVEREARR